MKRLPTQALHGFSTTVCKPRVSERTFSPFHEEPQCEIEIAGCRVAADGEEACSCVPALLTAPDLTPIVELISPRCGRGL